MVIVEKTTSAKGHTMPYIKLLTVLAGLALLTACGGAATPKTDNTGGDTNTGEVNTTDCTATPFDTNCDAVESAITSRQTMCFASVTANPSCGAVIEGACKANPFHSNATCMADTYLPNRIAECIKGGEADEGKCATITTDAEKNTMVIGCLTNPFDIVCQTSVTDFATYTDTARMNRLDFCDDNANVANDFCTGNNLVIICEADPFNAICFTGTTYATPRQEACLMDIDEDPSCTGEMGIVTLFCKADPFSTETACMADTYLPDRIADCITTENTGETKCDTLTSDSAMNTMITDCLTNPFATACESVSAFRSSFALARTNRASFCNDNMNVANALCTDDNVGRVCGFDPFTAICFTGDTYATPRQTACLMDIMEDDSCRGDMGLATVFCKDDPFHDSNACMADTYLPLRLAECIMAGNAGESKCDTVSTDTAMNDAITDCLENPFATACESVDGFTTFALARTNRLTFCNDNMNVANGLCTDTNLMNVCVFDPFNAICFTGATYDPNRQTACLLSLDADDKCLGEMGIATVFCKANPFDTSAGCTEHPEIRSFQNTNCLDNSITPKHSTCTELVAVNHADYLASFGDTPPPATVAEAVADTDIPSHFLSVGADGVIDRAGLGRATPATTLSRTGDAMDGVTYVSGSVENVTQSFVGLLPNTNLGAPLIEAPMDTTWEGRYYLLLNNATHPITFNVTFGAGDQAGTITTDPDIRGTYTTTFTLSFTAEGVITGNVLLGSVLTDDTAQARGLIGEQGLVGVFANTDGGVWGGSLHGGFVADNPDYTAPE